MTWGVFKTDNGVHVAPCTDQGYVLPGHRLEARCPCRPDPVPSPFVKVTPRTNTFHWSHHDNH